MKKTIAASTIFLLFLISGGALLSLTRFLPEGVPRTVVILVLGTVFVGIFIWLLITRVRSVLGGTKRLFLDLGLVAFDLVLLLLAFAWMYQMVGVIDNTPEGSGDTVANFIVCVYYSIVTFTTLGYGDFIPQGLGRALAAMQALTGYLILGILASTAASILSPHQEPGRVEEES